MESWESDIGRLAVLKDDVRRQMYSFARRQARAVSREEVAKAVGVSPKLAAFHLDKLVEEGLLEYHYARPPGRSGPGAGRPSKMYEISDLEIEVSIPERRYDLLGKLLVDALQSQSPDAADQEEATRVAWEAGLGLGRAVRQAKRLRPPGPQRALTVAEQVLAEQGFEPYRNASGEVALRNCPFHALARYAPELVCRMNQALIDGLVRGLGNENVEVILEPVPGECCVKLRPPQRVR